MTRANELIGARSAPRSDLTLELLRRSKLPTLFEAGELGQRKPSAATAGTLLYVATHFSEISDDFLRPFVNEIQGLVNDRGSVEVPPEYRITVETNWADAWCLAALLQRPHLADERTIQRMSCSLLGLQEPSGAWSLRSDYPGKPHPLFCLPVAIVIRRLKSLQFISVTQLDACCANLQAYLRGQRQTTTSLGRVLVAAIQNLIGIPAASSVLNNLHRTVWRLKKVHIKTEPLGRHEEPLWYTDIDRRLMLLCTLRLWPADDPLNETLAQEILASFDETVGGWKNAPEDKSPCTWRTAESLLALHLYSQRRYGHSKQGASATLAAPKEQLRGAVKRFRIAFSFAGEKRPFVSSVADAVAAELGRDRVLYDKYYEHELARPDGTYLPSLYRNQSDLIAVFLSAEYNEKEWCGLELRAILDLVKARQLDTIMLFRFDDADIPGFYGSDGYIDVRGRDPTEIAQLILKRLESNDRIGRPVPDRTALAASVPTPATRREPGRRSLATVKLDFIERLGPDWLTLADILEIPLAERDQFAKGFEARAIWEWLQRRGRLGDLADALARINRNDLAVLLSRAN